MSAKAVLAALKRRIRKEKAAFLPGFFDVRPGGYGEGDHFLGVVVPDQRAVAKQFASAPLSEIEQLVASKWHECRLTGMIILVNQFTKAFRKSNSNRLAEGRVLLDFYLSHLDGVNNWDIVDTTSPKILGAWILEHTSERTILSRFARSTSLWKRRIAVVATLPLIREHQFVEILALSKRLLHDPHPLMHKAIGWMLREVGKRDLRPLEEFLENHAHQMPRTMLRYSIEKLSKPERQLWLQK